MNVRDQNSIVGVLISRNGEHISNNRYMFLYTTDYVLFIFYINNECRKENVIFYQKK